MKILMLHGHGQSGPNFYHKTRFLLENLATSILSSSPFSQEVHYIFLNGPHKPNPEVDDDIRVWGYGDFEQGNISLLDKSLELVLEVLKKEGPFTGVIGFSAGAAIAAILTSQLEKNQQPQHQGKHPPFQFAIGFSGFTLGKRNKQSLYGQKIQTPMLHFSGSLDFIVPTHLTEQLAECFEQPKFRKFEGVHYVPRSSDAIQAITEFIHASLYNTGPGRIENLPHSQSKEAEQKCNFTIQHIDLHP